MTRTERFREATNGILNLTAFAERSAAGWHLVALEWERDAEPGAPASATSEFIPFGTRVAPDCLRLEIEPDERRILTLIMDGIAQDLPLSHIASGLNEKGFRSREGQPWTPVPVFELLPRLIEAGPSILRSPERAALRAASAAAPRPRA